MVSRKYYRRFKYVFFIVFRTTFTGVPVAFPENGLNARHYYFVRCCHRDHWRLWKSRNAPCTLTNQTQKRGGVHRQSTHARTGDIMSATPPERGWINWGRAVDSSLLRAITEPPSSCGQVGGTGRVCTSKFVGGR